MKELLLFAYFYPPLGGPGIQRPVKLVKYLKDFGWEVDVITVKNIVFHSFDYSMLEENRAKNTFYVPSIDPMSILNRISSNKKEITRKVYFKTPEKIKKLIRSSFFIDDKIGWLPFALKKAYKLCKNKKYDAVMATMGPYTSGIIAYYVSRKFKIPLIIDYRDHWTLHPYINFITPIHKKIAEYWEYKILRFALVISTASKSIKSDLLKKYGDNIEPKIHVMYNGWDEIDFDDIKQFRRDGNIIIRYIGNFYGHQTPKYFIKALDDLMDAGKMPEDIKFEFIGNFYKDTQSYIRNSKISEYLTIIPQVNHKKALEYLMNSDVLLLFIGTPKGKGVFTGKLFEYIRSGKEILAMVPPDGEAAEILKDYNHTFICPMEDSSKISEMFLNLYNLIKDGKTMKRLIPEEASRKNQTKEFVYFIENKIIK